MQGWLLSTSWTTSQCNEALGGQLKVPRGPRSCFKLNVDASGVLLHRVAFRAFSRWLHCAGGTVAAVQPDIELTQPAGYVWEGSKELIGSGPRRSYQITILFLTCDVLLEAPLSSSPHPPYDPTNTAPSQPTTNLFFQASRLL